MPCSSRPSRIFARAARILAGIGMISSSSMSVAAPLYYEVSWIGNSEPGGRAWVQQNVRGIFVAPDGTVYAAVEWDEAGREVGIYKDGKVVGMAGHTHGWGYHGGAAVTANDKYVYFAQSVENEGGGLRNPDTWPAKGKAWFGVSRRLRSDITKGAPFEGGKGGGAAEGRGEGSATATLKSAFLLVNETDEKAEAPVRGLWATNDRLYVSDPANGKIRIYDAETMREVGSWAVDRPNQMAADKDGMLWVIQKGDAEHPAQVLRFSSKGDPQPQKVTFDQSVNPTALCFDAQGRLWVTDDGPAQQILIYADPTTDPKPAGTFGKRGGIFGPPPLPPPPAKPAPPEDASARVTLKLENTLLLDALRMLTQNAEIVIANEQELTGKTVSLNLSERPVPEALDLMLSPHHVPWYRDEDGAYLINATKPAPPESPAPALAPGSIPGEFGDLRFNSPMGVGCDRDGNLYVASDGSTGGGGTVLESYDPAGALRWRLFGLEFVDMADVDPGSDTDVYTKEEHFRMDYSRPAGKEWTYAGTTVGRFKYPEDPRLHLWSAGAWVRRIEGKPFLFVNDMNAEYLQVYRFDPAREREVAVPSGLFAKRHIDMKGWPPHQPEKGEWVWRDANGNGRFDAGEFTGSGADTPDSQGWWVDSAGNVWLATETEGIRMVPLQRLDEKGNPVWDVAGMKTFPKPAEFDRVKRLRYDPETDTLYLGGTKGEDTNQHWKPMGPVLCRYDGWLKGEKKLAWRIVAPYEKGSQGHESCEPMTFDLAGEYLFVPYTGAGKTLGFSTGHVEIFRASDGGKVGGMAPTPDIGEIGLQDVRECIRAHRRADGEYLIFLEEDWKSKVLMFRWKP